MQADGRIAVHPFFPDGLFHAAHVDAGHVGIFHPFDDAIRREVTVGASRVSDGHAIVAFLVAVQ